MIATEHRVSELISLYKKLANVFDSDAKTKSAKISNYVTRHNLLKSLSSLSLSKILVVGASGDWASLLAKNGFEVSLIDPNIEMLKQAEETFFEQGVSINIFDEEFENTSFEDLEFDLVFADEGILSILPDPVNMMKEFRRITKSGGYIWIDYLNLLGWSILQPDVDSRLALANKDEEIVYMGKDEFPLRFFSPKKIRHMLYDAGFLELNEFGNGILTNPMMDDYQINGSEDELKKTELEFSRNYNMNGAAFHVQVLAQKIIY